ncbi:respiratory nitrate reductase subunit gamma [Amycolatopsis cihanbeyliensis]|uniref:Nitrate reductase-like protein NarX n=1 Tax=Amycolatopsis cihanbeyliensis TaxID=1128664 RepID=A0A542DDY7_AMYCI|nr:respiratory nitrate reductase subunit gamma [Amycolatopsis cihanbeyliensis]TQJ01288.1 nitrate reductase gamma subunit [Amycolatopsis cihanbeyliensis]
MTVPTAAQDIADRHLSALDILLWAVVPYVSLAVFVVGHIWRYRYDKFGWTTRSSQLYESRLLRLGSPLFHFGILIVVIGHVGGLLIPKSWTQAFGISQTAYHAIAVVLGVIAGFSTLAGAAILIYRRRTVGPVFSSTTRNDKIMYVLLVGTIGLGLGATVLGNLTEHPHDYRETVSPWFRSIFYFQPDPSLMRQATLGFQLHTLAAWALFAFWPFSRLVHVFSMPLGYLTRPYIVYRSRDTQLGSRSPHRGWERQP